ncbi:MerR family transcriptional regulator [Viscerimonas tarda]
MDSNKLFYSIKEVAAHFNVEEHTLRYWEKKFDEIRPGKTEGGIRQYTQKDIEAVQLIYSLLKERKMTIEGAQQTLKTRKDEETRRIELLNRLESIKTELEDLRMSFDGL